MASAALGVWIINVLVGAYLWTFTLGIGRPESNARTSNLPQGVLFVHPLVNLTGLGLWVVVMNTDGAVLPWVVFGTLLLGALLGDLLLVRTIKGGGRTVGAVPVGADPMHTPEQNHRYNATRAEDQIPRAAIVVHGLLAGLLLLLVLLEALSR